MSAVGCTRRQSERERGERERERERERENAYDAKRFENEVDESVMDWGQRCGRDVDEQNVLRGSPSEVEKRLVAVSLSFTDALYCTGQFGGRRTRWRKKRRDVGMFGPIVLEKLKLHRVTRPARGVRNEAPRKARRGFVKTRGGGRKGGKK